MLIPPNVQNAAEKAEMLCEKVRQEKQRMIRSNHQKVLQAFNRFQVSEECFKGSTGYGYADYGRDVLEAVFAQIFGAEAGLVRLQIVSGTHAIALCLFGILKPGDRVVAVTGTPYDTLLQVIGYPQSTPCSLTELGIAFDVVNLDEQGQLDYEAIASSLKKETKMILIQRSRGYCWRPSIDIDAISRLIAFVKKINPETICFVDNCYGEFVEEKEPTEVNADLVAGSLIKNPGGGLAPSGGYIVGKQDLIERISYRLTAPGIGKEVGSTPGYIYRMLYQGLFLAPHIVSEALLGAVFASSLFSELGFEVAPRPTEKRTDIIQAIKLGERQKLIAFCQALQKFSPVDAHVSPEPTKMPGYENEVIMAGGTFIQGSTIELSADAPLRPPYAVYLQGGLSAEYVKIALINTATKLNE